MHLSNNENINIYGINWKDYPKKAKLLLNSYGDPYKDIGQDIDGRLSIELGVNRGS